MAKPGAPSKTTPNEKAIGSQLQPRREVLAHRRFPSAHKVAKSRSTLPRTGGHHARVAGCDNPTQIAELATFV
ncbi:hypothetical protein GA0061099_1006204 [Bradyrhizobium yuanmingense]|uniref:Uncharacterized protein n=1 Tax=Bradyrhizobium yuanmingense TaxID=108015 RepID=A0A1C3WI97_9BRAD|nr:hypothetical protein IQ15_04557 [Bradyrhizobium yuanmingense]SCB39751.1 hypothetical protein GA0061099_1006204 [Bradyrhizobium yuanmingense]